MARSFALCDHHGMTCIALIRDVYYDDAGGERLRDHLSAARKGGAELAVLPEIPLNSWAPATTSLCQDDAEPLGGSRFTLQSDAAREVGIGLVGGAIVTGVDGRRRNTALVFSAEGALLGTYAKCHIPEEPGFHESHHYDPGEEFATTIAGLAIPLGVQICSDANRPQGTQVLAALGAELVVVPRSTESATWHRWRPVMVSSAITCCCYVATVNRPAPEQGVLIGGPSFAVAPDGTVLLETEDTIGFFDADRTAMSAFKGAYPGYIAVRPDLYLDAWRKVQDS